MATVPQVGATFARHRIDSQIGFGGMGVVSAATDTAIGRTEAAARPARHRRAAGARHDPAEDPLDPRAAGLHPDAHAGPDGGGRRLGVRPVADVRARHPDVDGDGLGDVGFVDRENKVIHLWSSSGEGFGEKRTQESPDGPALVAGVTGDETVDLVDVAGTRGTVAVAIQSGDERTRAAAQTPGSGFRGAVLAGDFDGDGRDDLALAGWGDGTLSINVARSKRDGGLSSSRTWFSASGDDQSLSLASGDFDGDGADELVLASVRKGEPRLTVLRREGRVPRRR